MSCKTFLRSFAYQYCRHKYIKKNCCASHKTFCLKRGSSSSDSSRTQRRRTLVFRPSNSNTTSSSNASATISSQPTDNFSQKIEAPRQTSSNANLTSAAFRNNSYTRISRHIQLSALPSTPQQRKRQTKRFRTNRSRFYRRSIEEDGDER